MRNLVVILLVLALLTVLPTGSSVAAFPPPFYSAPELRGTVVDAATGKPLQGVVVVAQWCLAGPAGREPRLHVADAVTDANGDFVIPGWGPRLRPPLTELREKSPELVLFKHGYVPVELANAPKSQFARLRSLENRTAAQISAGAGWDGNPHDQLQESLWNGMRLQLEPFDKRPKDWFTLLQSIVDAIAPNGIEASRRMYEAIGAQRPHLQANPGTLHPATLASFFKDIELRLNDGRR